MTWVTAAVIMGGATVATAYMGSQAAKSAAQTQADAARQAGDLQYKMWQEQQELQKPWREAGVDALTQMRSGTAAGGEYMRPFSMADYQADPGYSFRLKEGLNALDRSAAARGGLLSGAAIKAGQRYGQEMASNEYQNAYNRYTQQQGNSFNRLASMAGLGQTATGALGAAAGQYGQNVGNLITGAGAAQAAGQVGAANALSGGIGQGVSMYNFNRMMDRFGPQSSGGGGAGWGTGYQNTVRLPADQGAI